MATEGGRGGLLVKPESVASHGSIVQGHSGYLDKSKPLYVLWSLAALECKGIVDNWSAITGCWERGKYLAAWYGSLSDVAREQPAVDGQRHLDEIERAALQPASEAARVRRARPVDDVEEPSYDETDWTTE